MCSYHYVLFCISAVKKPVAKPAPAPKVEEKKVEEKKVEEKKVEEKKVEEKPAPKVMASNSPAEQA